MENQIPTLECITFDESNYNCYTDCGPVDTCGPDDE